MNLSKLTNILEATLTPSTANLPYQEISIDTRTTQPGNLFIAIKGENFDGHNFVVEAAAKGAIAAIIDKPITTNIPTIQVENTVHALGKIAAYHRNAFQIPVIGITGSCGKTTTRAFTASILQHCEPTLFSESSFNNHIGVPLTLLRLEDTHAYAVIEMGANHFGEIAYLTQMVKPTVAVITNAAAVHLEGFGSINGVCKAKGEIFQGLAPGGIAILNADDHHFEDWKKLAAPYKILSFSMHHVADVYAKNITLTKEGKPNFVLVTPQGETDIQLPLLGKHNINNALAAATATYAIGISLQAIKFGLEQSSAVKKRLNHHHLANNIDLIDDSYNASPLAVQAAIDLLAHRNGKKVLVLGDMKELGDHSTSAHQQIGEYARQAGINALYTYGIASELTSKAFGANAHHFTEQPLLIAQLKTDLSPSTTVLVKGSLSMKMSKVVDALLNNL